MVHERHEAKRVPPKLPEENITSAKLQAEQNMGAIFKNIECERESKAGSADCTSAKLSPAKKRHFQTFKKEYHVKWPAFIIVMIVDEKGCNTCMNSEVCSTVLKWLDWPTGELDWQMAFLSAQNW